MAYRKYSDDYTGQEASAKAARRGLWAGQFVSPWDWRRGKRLAAETAANDTPPACRIKGNIGSRGDRTYHMPFSRIGALPTSIVPASRALVTLPVRIVGSS